MKLPNLMKITSSHHLYHQDISSLCPLLECGFHTGQLIIRPPATGSLPEARWEYQGDVWYLIARPDGLLEPANQGLQIDVSYPAGVCREGYIIYTSGARSCFELPGREPEDIQIECTVAYGHVSIIIRDDNAADVHPRKRHTRAVIRSWEDDIMQVSATP